MAERSAFLAQGSTEVGNRLGLAGLFVPTTGAAVRTGVLAGGGVTQTTTATGQVSVAASWAVAQASSATGGAYLLTNDSPELVSVLSGAGSTPAEASPRNDLIVFEAGVGLRVVKGTANATPVDPAVPAQSVALARVRVKAVSGYAAGEVIVNADIDTLAVPTGLRGGVLPVATQAARDALTPSPGLVVYRVDTKTLETTDGATWRTTVPVRRTVSAVLAGAAAPSETQRLQQVINGGGTTSLGGDITVVFPVPFTTCVESVSAPLNRSTTTGAWFVLGAVSLTQVVIRAYTGASVGAQAVASASLIYSVEVTGV